MTENLATVTVRIPGNADRTFAVEMGDLYAAAVHKVSQDLSVGELWELLPADIPADPEADAIIEEAATDEAAALAYFRAAMECPLDVDACNGCTFCEDETPDFEVGDRVIVTAEPGTRIPGAGYVNEQVVIGSTGTVRTPIEAGDHRVEFDGLGFQQWIAADCLSVLA